MFDDFACDTSRVRRILLGHFLLCATALPCYSQAPPTIAEALTLHHVELTEAALVQALLSPDKEVRGLAAAELAELKFTSALPDILRAAETEHDAQTQVTIASAATWMGSDQSLQLLIGICRNPAVSAYVRLDAARHVFDKQDHSCFPALVEMMRPPEETGLRISALSLGSQIKPKTEQEAQSS
jgi:HEAT repeat protein